MLGETDQQAAVIVCVDDGAQSQTEVAIKVLQSQLIQRWLT